MKKEALCSHILGRIFLFMVAIVSFRYSNNSETHTIECLFKFNTASQNEVFI